MGVQRRLHLLVVQLLLVAILWLRLSIQLFCIPEAHSDSDPDGGYISCA